MLIIVHGKKSLPFVMKHNVCYVCKSLQDVCDFVSVSVVHVRQFLSYWRLKFSGLYKVLLSYSLLLNVINLINFVSVFSHIVLLPELN